MARLIRKSRFIKRLFGTPIHLVSTVIICLLIIAGSLWWYLERPSRKATSTIPSTTSSQSSNHAAKNEKSSSSAATVSDTTPAKSSVAAAPSGSAAGTVPYTPWGGFVSNHHPGNGTPTTETSVCNTTPGASCYIKFTNDGQTRTLDTKVADANGSVVWNWDVSNAGFSSGSWQVSAVATLNGQTASATDTQALVIQ